jgi:site-specific DNA-methyltransferase (adenine-specific)
MTSFDIHEGDALSFLQERVPSSSVDLIITDPPYESLEKHRKSGTTTRLKNSKGSSNVWFPVIKNQLFVDFFTEWMRVLKPGRHLYVFCDPETSYEIVPIARSVGWRWGNRLIWDKMTIGMGYHYRRRYEDILFFTHPKGKKRRLADLGIPDVLPCKRLKGKGYYPTEKPVPLIEVLVQQSSERGELVLDSFAGSGSTGEAALINSREFLGSDVTPEAVRRASERLSSPFLPERPPGPVLRLSTAQALLRAA